MPAAAPSDAQLEPGRRPKPPPVDYLSAAPFTRGTVLFHVLGGVLEGTLLLAIGAWLWRYRELAPGPLGWLLGLGIGLFLADFVSGLLHWAFDTWFDETHPVLQRMVIMVREHHIYPQRIFKFPFYHDAGVLSWIVFVLTAPPVLFAILVWPGPAPWLWAALSGTVFFSLLVVFMLEFHKVGHRSKVGPVLHGLRRCGLLLEHRHHVLHHIGNHDVNYCLINGVADKTLGRLGVFRGLEALVYRLTGAVPQQNDHELLERYGIRRTGSGRAPGAGPT